MVEFNVEIAGCAFTVKTIHEETQALFKDYLTASPPEFTIESSKDKIRDERQLLKLNDEQATLPIDEFTDAEIESNYLYREVAEQLARYGIVLIHGSAVAIDGEAYIFVASSGTGKSTHARLWHEAFGSRVVTINDDKPLVRITDDGVYVYGSPWNGKHQLGANVSAHLKAICFLNRGKENRIEKISTNEAFISILKSVYHSGEAERESYILESLQSIRRNVSFYRLFCNISTEAAYVSYEGMKDGN